MMTKQKLLDDYRDELHEAIALSERHADKSRFYLGRITEILEIIEMLERK